MCEHPSTSLYIADQGDNKDPMLCDVTSDFDEVGRTNFEKETQPNKHPAVENEGDVAFKCNTCHMIVCKNCVEEYSSSENTPVSPAFPFTEASNLPFTEASNLPSAKDKEDANSPKTKNSLLDDYADTSAELPDYTSGDD